MNLLSTPLPVAVPASILPFLLELLDKASKTPSADTIRPIYRILSGVGSHLLDAIPSKFVTRLQEQFKKLLQSVGAQNHMTYMFCLAVLAVMASGQSRTSTLQDGPSSLATIHQTSSVEQSKTCDIARQYFTSKMAGKTLDVVILKVIFLFSNSCTLDPKEVVESLQISNVIINAVDDGERNVWMENDRGKLRKLVDKVILYDQRSDVVLCMVRPHDSIW